MLRLNLTMLVKGATVRARYDGYRQASNISGTIVGNEIVDHSDADGALPLGAAPTTSLFST